jgi:HSP20 family protein
LAERWEPLNELEQLTERLRRLFDQTLGFSWPPPDTATSGWAPLVDVEETDDEYIIEAGLPGVKREDVDVALLANELTFTGEIRSRERKGIIRRQARRTGRFDYRVTLPEQVAADAIEANLIDGVLTVRVPKSAQAERRKIEVSS